MIQAKTMPNPGQLSLMSVLIFACAYMPYSALLTSVAVQLPRFFAGHLGMGLAVGGVFGLVRLIDIPLDPALGLVMDRTRTRLGRYRIWLLGSAPVLMLAVYMLYQAQEGVSRGYLLIWLLIMYLGTSMLLLSNNAWASTLATTYKERSRIFGAMAGIGVLGAVSILIIPIVTASMGQSDADGIRAVGWFMMALAPVSILLTGIMTREPLKEAQPGGHFALKDYAALLVRPNILRLLVADLFITLGPGWMSALYLFFFKDSRGFSTIEANALLLIYIAAGLVGAPATAWLANRISKHRAMIVTTTGYSLMLIVIFLSPKADFLIAAPAMFIAGALAAGSVVMIRAITADVGDEVRLEKGQQQIGLLYALTSATTKLASAFAITLTFAVLGMVGYNPTEGAVNGPDQVRGLELAYAIGPIVFVMLAGACFLGFGLTPQKHAEIRRQLEERDALYDETPIVESLTSDPGEVAPSRS